MKKYSSRVWLSPDTHSSGYVMCYYDPECLNDETTNFIRIADCDGSQSMYFGTNQIKTAINVIDGIISVLHGKRSFSYKPSGSRASFKFSMSDSNEIKTFDIDRVSRIEKEDLIKPFFIKRNMVKLHCDCHTCSLEEWHRKLYILEDQLLYFKVFLQSMI